MAIPRKQIGWSQESNLLWEISRQMEKLTGVAFNSGGGGGGGVNRIIAGDNITISPTGGTGIVTINSVGGLITKTKSEIDSLISTNDLIPGQFYLIQGVNTALYGGTDIIIQAATENKLVDSAEGFFYNPNYNEFPIWTNIMPCDITPYGYFEYNEPVVADSGATGVFLSYGMIRWTGGDWSTATSVVGLVTETECPISGALSPLYDIGDKVIWGGKVWENINGNVGSSDDDFNLNSDEWAVIGYNTADYTLVVDEIKYNYENNAIYYRRDGDDNTSNIVDGYYESEITYLGVKNFQWGNIVSVIGNRVINSRCDIINFKGAYFRFNEILQTTNVTNIISDTTSFIEWNVITDGYMADCVLSQSSTISFNIMPLGGIFSNRISHSSHINENTLSFSSIYGNFVEGSSEINVNDCSSYCDIRNNYVFGSNINDNKIYNNSYIESNIIINDTSISNNSLDTECNISNLIQDGYNTQENFVEYNALSKNSNINNISYTYISRNNLFNNSSINSCGNVSADSLSISGNTIDNSDIINLSSFNVGVCTVTNNILAKGSSFNSITLDGNNVISYNNFFNSDFINCTLNGNTQFTNNTLENSNISYINGTWGTGGGILFTTCRMYNSVIDGNSIGQLVNNISNITITDVTLDQPISAATYIYQPYSKTISLALITGFDCLNPGSYKPVLSFMSLDCNTSIGAITIVDYTA